MIRDALPLRRTHATALRAALGACGRAAREGGR